MGVRGLMRVGVLCSGFRAHDDLTTCTAPILQLKPILEREYSSGFQVKEERGNSCERRHTHKKNLEA